MEFANPQEGLEKFRSRLGVAAGFVLFCFFLLFARFVWLQIFQYSYYKTRAEENRISLVPIVPNRGLIVDRNGVVMARNYSAYTLEITPSKVGDLEATIDGLAKIIDIQAKDRKRFKRLLEESKNFESLPIRNRLTDEEVAKFIAHRYRFPGVEIKARLFRQYPFGDLASHLLGYIGRIDTRDEDKISDQEQDDNYRGTDHFGKRGIEQHYEFQLHGITGFEQMEVDAGGRAVRTLARTAPVAGNNLTLTIDAKLQGVVEKAFGDRRGALVAIEPSTGGILALVSMPNFDPNLFVDGIDSQSWQELNDSPDKPMINRAVYGAYPPGSTFKPYMALAALEYGKRKPEQAISDPGFFNFGNHQFRDDKKGGHGYVDMYVSIAGGRLARDVDRLTDDFQSHHARVSNPRMWGSVLDNATFVLSKYRNRADQSEANAADRLLAELGSLAGRAALPATARATGVRGNAPGRRRKETRSAATTKRHPGSGRSRRGRSEKRA